MSLLVKRKELPQITPQTTQSNSIKLDYIIKAVRCQAVKLKGLFFVFCFVLSIFIFPPIFENDGLNPIAFLVLEGICFYLMLRVSDTIS